LFSVTARGAVASSIASAVDPLLGNVATNIQWTSSARTGSPTMRWRTTFVRNLTCVPIRLAMLLSWFIESSPTLCYSTSGAAVRVRRNTPIASRVPMSALRAGATLPLRTLLRRTRPGPSPAIRTQ